VERSLAPLAGYLSGMDVTSILGAAVCMVGMCGVMMWLMMRGHRGSKADDEHRTDRAGHAA
jgi:uncharacterized membrane protein